MSSIYMVLLFFSLMSSNVFYVWLINEFMLFLMLLFLVLNDSKYYSLIMYFFIQSVFSFLLFLTVYWNYFSFSFILMMVKLGLAPFHYWVVVITVEMTFFMNFYVLVFQKIVNFWLLWLLFLFNSFYVFLFAVFSILVSFFGLLLVYDLWLLMVYSSISNTGLILVSMFTVNYWFLLFLYMFITFVLIGFFFFTKSDDYFYLVMVLFLVVPPFFLFVYKYLVVVGLFSLKMVFFVMFFDVLLLIYYFSFIFIYGLSYFSKSLFLILLFFMFLSLILNSIYVSLTLFY